MTWNFVIWKYLATQTFVFILQAFPFLPNIIFIISSFVVFCMYFYLYFMSTEMHWYLDRKRIPSSSGWTERHLQLSGLIYLTTSLFTCLCLCLPPLQTQLVVLATLSHRVFFPTDFASIADRLVNIHNTLFALHCHIFVWQLTWTRKWLTVEGALQQLRLWYIF